MFFCHVLIGNGCANVPIFLNVTLFERTAILTAPVTGWQFAMVPPCPNVSPSTITLELPASMVIELEGAVAEVLPMYLSQ